MINHVWTILCSSAVIDKDSNKISLHDVIENIEIKTSPKPDGILPIHLELVTLWIQKKDSGPSVGQSRITFVSPSGNILLEVEPEVDLSKTLRTRNKIIFDGLPLGKSGRYNFQVYLKNNGDLTQVAEIPLSIKFSPQESAEEPITKEKISA